MFLVIITIIVVSMAAIYKVEEAQQKELIREKKKDKSFSFLSVKGFMALTVFSLLLPLFFMVKINIELLLLIIALSLVRFLPWVIVNVARGKYTNAKHQASTNFTMLENFAGPLGALIFYGFYNSINDGGANIFWYIITPFIGLFLLWALREEEKSTISKEMLVIILYQGLLVLSETGILVYINNANIVLTKYEYLNFVNDQLLIFIMIISVSSLMSGLYFSKDIISDVKIGVGYRAIKIGFIAGIHDLIYFIGFALFGPIFLIARRGLLIPVQNLYLGIKKGGNLIKLIKLPIKIPLLKLKGGKDFIISSTDLIFNRVVKVAISLA